MADITQSYFVLITITATLLRVPQSSCQRGACTMNAKTRIFQAKAKVRANSKDTNITANFQDGNEMTASKDWRIRRRQMSPFPWGTVGEKVQCPIYCDHKWIMELDGRGRAKSWNKRSRPGRRIVTIANVLSSLTYWRILLTKSPSADALKAPVNPKRRKKTSS